VAEDVDAHFYDRADALIELANAQLAGAPRGQVSASGLYAMSRFNAWVSACGHASAQEMAGTRAQTVAYFVEQYRQMLEDNFDDYVDHFDAYMKPAQDSKR